MINRNNSFISSTRYLLNKIGAGEIGRKGLLFFENFVFGSTIRLKIDGVEARFSVREPAERSYFRTYKNNSSYLEHIVLRQLIEVLRPGMCFYDVGAFSGLYSVFAAQCVGSSGIVRAFELTAENYRHLTINVQLNQIDNAQCYLCAAQDRTELVAFVQYGHQPDSAHSLIDIRGYLSDRRTVFKNVVMGVSLDDFALISGDIPDVLKIDVEGAEMRVLLGARQVVEYCRMIVCELHPKALKTDGYCAQDVLTFLSASGFKLYRIEGLRSDTDQSVVPIDAGTEIKRNTMILAKR